MSPLSPWMTIVLRVAGCFNLLAGVSMICFYHEGYELLRVAKPQLVLPVQVMGILVALFGVGYLIVAAKPAENRNLLLLGTLSKAIAAVFALYYVAIGTLPWWFAIAVFFADIIYVPPFCLILRRLYRAGSEGLAGST